jgi:hypothetical protein
MYKQEKYNNKASKCFEKSKCISEQKAYASKQEQICKCKEANA